MIDNSAGFVIMPAHRLATLPHGWRSLRDPRGVPGHRRMSRDVALEHESAGDARRLGPSLPMMGRSFGEGGFMAGLSLALIGSVGGFAVLVVFYF